jgi:hypothetical protein
MSLKDRQVGYFYDEELSKHTILYPRPSIWIAYVLHALRCKEILNFRPLCSV